jgi:hypothetical protein
MDALSAKRSRTDTVSVGIRGHHRGRKFVESIRPGRPRPISSSSNDHLILRLLPSIVNRATAMRDLQAPPSGGFVARLFCGTNLYALTVAVAEVTAHDSHRAARIANHPPMISYFGANNIPLQR